MAIRDTLRAWFSPPPALQHPSSFMGPAAERALASLFRTDGEWDHGNTTSGEMVSAEKALHTIAVQAAVRLLVNDIGSLPVDTYRTQSEGTDEITKPSWVVTPNPLNPNDTWEDHVKQVVFSILSEGNAFTRCFPSVYQPESIVSLDPETVDIITRGGETIYAVDGVGRLTPNEVVHIPWIRQPGKARGLDPITYAKEGLGIAIAADKYVGAFFGRGATLTGWFETPPGVSMDEQQVKDAITGFERKHVGAGKSHAVGAATGGLTFKPFEVKNRESQLLELRDSIVEDVARLFGIPPHMLGSQKPGAVGYASVEQRSIDYVTHAVLPIVRRIETGYSRLLRGQKTYLRFNVRGLLRGDEAARSAYYTALLNAKVIRREEVRKLEDLPFDPEGVGYLETPNNNAPEPAPAQEPQP